MRAVRDPWPRIVIAGAGVAALETLLAVRVLAGHRLAITLVAPQSEFVYRPVSVAEAFGHGQARRFSLEQIAADQQAELVHDALDAVDRDERCLLAASGARIPYDVLVVATGAVVGPSSLPGALAFSGERDVPALRALLDDLVDSDGGAIAFALPSQRNWPLPLYELAILTAAYLREQGSSTRVLIVTPEDEPLELFGPQAAHALRPMLAARGVELRTSSLPAGVTDDGLVLAGGGHVAARHVVTVPTLRGPRIGGLPADREGFLPVDTHGRVRGAADVYAAGDVTAFPIKQGGLAAQQADAVAEMIAAHAGAALTPRPFAPVLRGLLLTGGAPLYLRAEPQRQLRPTTVAGERPRRPGAGDASAASGQALWWPPGKIAGRYLAPYLATARPPRLGVAPLADRPSRPNPAVDEAGQDDAFELALLLADCDADWGDYHGAVASLEAATALHGTVPSEYEPKRQAWLAEIARGA